MTQAQEFLTSEYEKRKKLNASFSLRSFAKWLGVSPAQLSQMMAGKRAITPESLTKIVDRVGVSPSERHDLLASLVSPQTPVSTERQRLADDEFRLFADWYHLAILSLTKTKGAKADPRWIARRLGISVDDANKALSRLLRLKIIETSPNFRQISQPFEVTSDIPSEAIRRYHKQNLELAASKIETVALELRQYQSVALPLKPSQIPAFKKMIDQFLDRASESADSSLSASAEIYHLNVQLFPVSKPVSVTKDSQ